MKKQIIAGIVISSAVLAIANPTWMWVGSAAINDHSVNGGSLVWQKATTWADKFFTGAQTYSNYNGTTGQPVPYRNVALTGTSVTKNSLKSGSDRLASDFWFSSNAHTRQTSMFKTYIGTNSGYEPIEWAGGDWKLGTTYNRWVVYADNAGFNNTGYADLDTTFRGLQGAMGFTAVSSYSNWWTTNSPAETFGGQFWVQWAYFDRTQWLAFRDATIYMANNSVANVNLKYYSSKSPSDSRYYYNDTYSGSTSEKAIDEAWTYLTYSNI